MITTATSKQIAFLERLSAEKTVPEPIAKRLEEPLDVRGASQLIGLLMRLPDRAESSGVTEPGVYRKGEELFLVKFNRDKSHLYAMRIVDASGQRAMEDGGRDRLELEYEAGAVRRLDPGSKLSLEEGKALTARYGRCICCGSKLKAAESVERGIGPVCRKFYS